MSVQVWTYLIVGLTFAIYIGIAIWAKAGSTKEFYVAGAGVHPMINGMATAADWMSAASFISMAGLISFMGYDGSVYLMGWTGGYVLLALLLAPYLRKFGKFTVPDFVGDRYYSNAARTVAVICAIFVSFTYVAGQMRGVGVVFSRFLEVDINTGIIIGMAIVFFLRRARRHEGHHLHAGCPVLGADLRLHGSGHLPVDHDYQQRHSAAWPRRHHFGRRLFA
jgi:cation/acetate symporter